MLGNDAQASICLERTKSAPFGLAGGKAGATARIAIETPDGTVRELNSKGGFPAPGGSRILLEVPGSGGFGPAEDRDPVQLAADVKDGYVSAEGAKRDYGLDI